AFSDLFDIMDKHFSNGQAILHCFTGTQEEAKEGIQRGYFISFSGIVTFKKSIELSRIAQEVPLKSILIETDSPYLAPQPYRGLKNEPMFLEATCAYLAQLKKISFEEMALVTASNAENIFAFH
ncbi:MAG: TatD family hydrolase, partial [Parachlamydiaceae bacterium]